MKIIHNKYVNNENEMNTIKQHVEQDLKTIELLNINENRQKRFRREGMQILRLIREKEDFPDTKAHYLGTFEDDIEQLKEDIKLEVGNNNKKIQSCIQLMGQIENYARAWVGKKLQQNTLAKNRINDIKKLISKNQDLDKNIKIFEDEIKQKKEAISTLKFFKAICNQKFELLGINLKLEIKNSGYILLRPDHSPLSVEQISEGEKRILAFLLFYYSLYDTETNLNSNIEDIVIDDPVTSLDTENRYEIIEMINKLVTTVLNKDKYPKIGLYIMTNSSYTFMDIGYRDRTNGDFSKWKIYKDNEGNSKIRKIEKNSDEYKNYSSYYRSLFQDVLNFALLNRQKLQAVNNPIQFCNKTRIVLESHAFTNYAISNATGATAEKIMEDYEVKKNLEHFSIDDLKKDLDIINANSHGFSYLDEVVNDGYSNKEIQQAIRDVIAIIYSKDKFHVKSMLPVKEGFNSRVAENRIKEWCKIYKSQ